MRIEQGMYFAGDDGKRWTIVGRMVMRGTTKFIVRDTAGSKGSVSRAGMVDMIHAGMVYNHDGTKVEQ